MSDKAERRKSGRRRKTSHSSMWSSAAQQDDKSVVAVHEMDFLEEEELLPEISPLTVPEVNENGETEEGEEYDWIVYDGSAEMDDQEVDTSKLVEKYLHELKLEQASGNWEAPEIPKRFSRRRSSGASARIKQVLADEKAKEEAEKKKRLSQARRAKAKKDALPKRVVEINNPGVKIEVEITERTDLMDMVNEAFAKPTFAKKKAQKKKTNAKPKKTTTKVKA